jgi:hypothetical protein
MRVLIEPNAAYAAMGVVNVVSRMSQRLMPSTATCQRMPSAGIQSLTYWKCQPAVIGTESRSSEARKPSASTASVKPRSTVSICRGTKSTITAPSAGRPTSTLSRCGHSPG